MAPTVGFELVTPQMPQVHVTAAAAFKLHPFILIFILGQLATLLLSLLSSKMHFQNERQCRRWCCYCCCCCCCCCCGFDSSHHLSPLKGAEPKDNSTAQSDRWKTHFWLWLMFFRFRFHISLLETKDRFLDAHLNQYYKQILLMATHYSLWV